MLGFGWLVLWRLTYYSPEQHPRISPEERAYILAGREEAASAGAAPLPYRTLLALPQTWGIVVGKALTDPVWFFITDWFAIYLVSRGYRLEESLLAFWVPFLAADLGNFAGGGISSYLIARGWSVGWARKIVVLVGGLGMTLLAPTVWIDSYVVLVTCFAISTFCYAAVSTMILNLPADVYPTASVASVSGLSGTGAGIGTITATLLIGRISDQMSFAPILIGASIVPLFAVVAVLALVRNTAESRERRPQGDLNSHVPQHSSACGANRRFQERFRRLRRFSHAEGDRAGRAAAGGPTRSGTGMKASDVRLSFPCRFTSGTARLATPRSPESTARAEESASSAPSADDSHDTIAA